MIFLVLTIVLGTSFLQLFRLAQVRGGRVAAIGMLNYAVASLACAARWLLLEGAATPQLATVVLGLSNGILYLLHLAILLHAMKVAGLGLTTAVTNTSAVIPVLVALVLWGEPVTVTQWAAILLMPIALLLMRRGSDPVDRLSATADLWLLGSMLMQGAIQVIHKIAQQELPADQQPVYSTCVFGMAAVVGVGWMIRARAWPRTVELGMGTLIGVVNAGVLTFILLGLREISAATFFTVTCIVPMSLNVISGRFLWGETLQRRHWAGLALAIAVVALAQQWQAT